MSLHSAADVLQHITDAINIDATSPPPVYALMHPLGLAHNLVPFVGGTLPPQDPPLQIAVTTVTMTLTHAQQQSHVGSSSGSSGGRDSGSVRLKLAFCTTCAVRVLVLAQGPSFLRLRRALLRRRGDFTR